MVAPRATTEAPRRPRERPMTPSRRIHFVDTPAPPRSLRRAFPEPLRTLHQFNKPPVQPQLPRGCFHSESVIPSAKPCVVSIFLLGLGLGLGLGLELRLCKKMSTEPPWRHHGCFTDPSLTLRGATGISSNNGKPPVATTATVGFTILTAVVSLLYTPITAGAHRRAKALSKNHKPNS